MGHILIVFSKFECDDLIIIVECTCHKPHIHTRNSYRTDAFVYLNGADKLHRMVFFLLLPSLIISVSAEKRV